ncbi:MAG: isochorismatase family protein [Actinomycetota bacterium]|nr:isochorismatase family protein [Actinomycetota bacterium]
MPDAQYGPPMDRFIPGRSESVLIVVDVQEKLAAVMEEGVKEKTVLNIVRLIEGANILSVPVIITEQYPKGLGSTASPVKKALPLVSPVEKITFDCCGEPAFLAALSGRKKIILTGMEAHICVLQTCLGLLERGFYVHAVANACCSRKKEDYKTGIDFMRNAGAVITTAETVLFQLAGRAGTDEFRAISKLIK